MSNLLKYNHVVVKNEDKHVIDSNELLKNILSAKKIQHQATVLLKSRYLIRTDLFVE